MSNETKHESSMMEEVRVSAFAENVNLVVYPLKTTSRFSVDISKTHHDWKNNGQHFSIAYIPHTHTHTYLKNTSTQFLQFSIPFLYYFDSALESYWIFMLLSLQRKIHTLHDTGR